MKTRFLTIAIATAFLGFGTLPADVTHIQRSADNSMYDVTNDPWQPEAFEDAIVVPAAFVAVPDIVLDGRDDEPEWARAEEIPVPLSFGLVRNAWIKALYSDEQVFIRVRWEDATEGLGVR